MSEQLESPARPGVARRLAGLPWGWIVPVAIGAALGLSYGWQYRWLESGPSSGPFSATFGLTLLAFFGGGAAALLALLLLVPQRTRRAGYAGFRLLLGVVLGAMVGMAVAPRYQFGGSVLGTLQVRLTSPVAVTIEAQAICGIEDNGNDIEAVGTLDLGRVGVDSLSAQVGIGRYGGLRVLVNGGSGYEGSVTITSTGPDARTGSATFATSSAGRYRLGGEDGAESIAGELSWACTETPAPSPEPDLSHVSSDPMQGWFSLSGIVDMPHPCSGDGPCQPYGRAIASCYRDVPYRANHIETVVPWIGESRARLTLEFNPGAAELTVEVDDGSPAETVRGRPKVAERGGGLVQRVVSADFELAAGRLHLEVEYTCSDNVEPQ